MPSGHIDRSKLNQLSEHAWGVLRRIAARPTGVARHTINPGVRERLSREGLIEEAGQSFKITAAGLEKVR